MVRIIPRMSDLRTRFVTGTRRVALASVPLIALLLIGLVFFLGIRTERTGFVRDVLDPGIKRITHPVLNAFRGSPPAVDRLTILLTEGALDSLLQVRDSALLAGYLEAERNLVFNAEVVNGRDTVVARAELMAGPVDHLRTNKWQLSVKGDRPMGPMHCANFRLDDPKRTGHLHGWLLHRAAELCDVPSLSMGLSEVMLNERFLGLYTTIEIPDSSTLHRWGLGNGPIVAFDRTVHDRASMGLAGLQFTALPLPQEQLSTSTLTILPTGEKPAADRSRRALALLTALQLDSKPLSELLDVERTAALFAIHDLLGAQSALRWTQLAFVLDSAGTRLIPFVLHPQAGTPIAAIGPLALSTKDDVLIQRIHADRTFRPRYHHWLDRISEEGWSEDLHSQADSTIAQLDRTLQVEFPDNHFDRRIVAHDRTIILRTLYPQDLAIAIAQDGPEGFAIRISNIHALPVIVEALIQKGDTLPLISPLLLPARLNDRPLDYWEIPLPDGDVRASSHVLLRVEGTLHARAQPMRRRSTLDAQGAK